MFALFVVGIIVVRVAPIFRAVGATDNILLKVEQAIVDIGAAIAGLIAVGATMRHFPLLAVSSSDIRIDSYLSIATRQPDKRCTRPETDA